MIQVVCMYTQQLQLLNVTQNNRLKSIKQDNKKREFATSPLCDIQVLAICLFVNDINYRFHYFLSKHANMSCNSSGWVKQSK